MLDDNFTKPVSQSSVNTEIEFKIIKIKGVVMAKKHMGEVKNPTGSSYDYYWDEDTGEVYVGPNSAGKASSAEEAWRKANFYATTLQKWKD
ncbi:hypothetical protein QUA56_14885 [Microcoleus sp. N3A4]|uniref:hypothetical protein n=1 Tax=Microcoleus sp. N3A4 TaxID=3055379 RepID=UPI002FD5AA90